MNVPPLVSLSPDGTPPNRVGVLDEPGTQVLFGGGEILDRARYGSRFVLGYRWDNCSPWSLEGDYLGIFRTREDYFRESTTENIGRPFNNALTGLPDAELVSVPNVLGGSVTVAARTKFDSAGARLKFDLCRCNSPDDACEYTSHRLGVFAGYRFHQLVDRLKISENLTDPNTQGTFDLFDRFDTRNRFHGLELGLEGQWQRNHWSIEADGSVAFGTNYQTVTIDGRTISQLPGFAAMNDVGGLLAQTTNIGVHRREQFAAIPQFGVSLGYHFWKELRLSVGYRLIVWPEVVRSGDQIDPVVNPNLIPPQTLPIAGPARPQFDFHESRYVAQGLSIGLTLDW